MLSLEVGVATSIVHAALQKHFIINVLRRLGKDDRGPHEHNRNAVEKEAERLEQGGAVPFCTHERPPAPLRMLPPWLSYVQLSPLKTDRSRSSCGLQTDSLCGGHDAMVRNRPWDTEKLLSNAPRVGPREPRAAAATRRVEGPRAAAAVDRDGPTVLGVLIEGVEEVAAFAARGAAGDGRPMASAGISTLLGVEESAPIGSAHDQYGASRSDSADERRQSAVGSRKRRFPSTC
jgi:hypothetical protein